MRIFTSLKALFQLFNHLCSICHLFIHLFSATTGEFYETDRQRSAFGKPEWFDKVKSEYWVCREGVSLIDMSTFSKFELQVKKKKERKKSAHSLTPPAPPPPSPPSVISCLALLCSVCGRGETYFHQDG